MKKYQCEKCKHYFYGMDDQFEYDDNICEECESTDAYKEVKEKDYTIEDFGAMLDEELENANRHSFCGLGEAIVDVISSNVVNDALAKKLVKAICHSVYDMI